MLQSLLPEKKMILLNKRNFRNFSVFARTSGTDDVTSGGITARNFHTNMYELVSNA